MHYERVRYDAWGGPTFINSAGVESNTSFIGSPFAFTGRRWEPETRLYYYRYRYFDPQLGRFTTRDPIGIWGDALNLGNGFGYTNNNPWSYIDPLGLESDDEPWYKDALGCFDPLLEDLFEKTPFARVIRQADGGHNGAVYDALGIEDPTDAQEVIDDIDEALQEGAKNIAEEAVLGAATGGLGKLGKADDVVGAMKRSGDEAGNGDRKVNNRRPRNADFAGKNYQLPGDLQKKYPKGVDFTPEGFPKFDPYAKHKVPIEMKGDSTDYKRANKAAGLDRKPDGWTWHHHEDGKHMLLVPTGLHSAIGHTGGAAIVKEACD